MKFPISFTIILLLTISIVFGQNKKAERKIIDAHFHSFKWNEYGNSPPSNPITGVLPKAKSDGEVVSIMIAKMRENNIVKAIVSGSLTSEYKSRNKDLIIEGMMIYDVDELPDTSIFISLINTGKMKVFGELGLQYSGKMLTDSSFEPYLSICERMNIPVALHTGLGDPGTPYTCCPKFRTHLGNPQLIEEVLVRHPKLKVQLMHMGYPYLEATKAILLIYPQVFVDVAVIDWIVPIPAFYDYLKALIDAGFENRIMYGSDEMIWEDAIPISIKNIENAPFLSQKQKQDIFYNNAVKFFNIHQ